MDEFTPLPALLGGVLIGLATVSLLWANARPREGVRPATPVEEEFVP